jgi:phosphate transport system permease protein
LPIVKGKRFGDEDLGGDNMLATSWLFLGLLLLVAFAYLFGKRRILAISTMKERHSLPSYYGLYVALWAGGPALLLLLLWVWGGKGLLANLTLAHFAEELGALSVLERSRLVSDLIGAVYEGREVAATLEPLANYWRSMAGIGTVLYTLFLLCVGSAGGYWALSRLKGQFRARIVVERVVMLVLIAASTLAVLTTLGIVLSLLFEALRFFSFVPLVDFLFGTQWSPQTALRADQVGASGAFGAVPLFIGTAMVAGIAMVVAVPIGLFSAIYLAEFAPRRMRQQVKPLLEILAGIPTVVFGFFAALTLAPAIRSLGVKLGLDVAAQSALAAGLVMGMMIIPFVSSLSDDVINAVPQALRDGSYGLGATRAETIWQVVVPAALPGIVGAILLAVSRAIGETMIVVMAAGLTANLTANPLDAVTTVTVQIATILVGDQEFDSPKTLSAFALGLVLFIVTLLLNIYALSIVKKYREKYD